MPSARSVALELVRQRIKVRLAYRADFVALAGSNLMLAGVGMTLLLALFHHLDRLGQYSSADMLFSWGFAEAAVGLFYVIFGGLYALNQRYILGGELDRVLLRPFHPLAQILLDNISLEDLPTVALGFAVMGLTATQLPPLPWSSWLLLPLLLAGATAVLGGIVTLVSSIGFHLHHRGTAVGLVFQLSTFGRYPMDLFARPLRLALTFALPIGFAGFYPASIFLGRSEWSAYALASPLVGLVCIAVGLLGWRWGLARYTSSGT